MKKLLLLSLFSVSAFSQTSPTPCDTATPITLGLNHCAQITGFYPGSCAAGGNLPSGTQAYANWFVYTPASNGELTVSSNLSQNDGNTNSNDTRLSIVSGDCTSNQFTCEGGSNDISSTNLLSEITIPVTGGTTYYILWDNLKSDKPFDFNVNLNTTVCIRPGANDVQIPNALGTTSVQLSWNAAVGTPAGYDVEYGPQGFTQGTGTTLHTTTNSITIDSGLTAGGDYWYYYRSACDQTNSSVWVGPFAFYLAKTLPYANGFDDANDRTDGALSLGWTVTAVNTAFVQAGTGAAYSVSSTSAPTQNQLFTRAIALEANQQVTITFYTRLAYDQTGAGDDHMLYVYALKGYDDPTGGVNLTANGIDVAGTNYVKQTVTFTADATGVYYFDFIDATPQVTTVDILLLDTINIATSLKVNEYLTSQFSVYPNPVKNVVTLTNGLNAQINAVEMTDLNGRVVKSLNVNSNESQISIGDLSTGVYMMRITTDQGVAVKKIIKE